VDEEALLARFGLNGGIGEDALCVGFGRLFLAKHLMSQQKAYTI
jgi:hypothetical protein